MQMFKKYKKAMVALVLAVLMILGTIPLAEAAQTYFPLYDDTHLVANDNTLYITELSQDPVSKMITATLKVFNGNPAGGETLYIGGFGFEVAFDGARVAPYRYDPSNTSDPHEFDVSRMYLNQGPNANLADNSRYLHAFGGPLNNFNNIGSAVMCNNTANGSFFGGKITAFVGQNSNPANSSILVAPGATEPVLEMFFMPISTADNILDINMFRYQFVTTVNFIEINTWLANNKSMVYASNKAVALNSYTYVISAPTFKMHFVRPVPTGVTADLTNRAVVGYNATQMEWSYDGVTYRSDVPPIVLDDAHTIYVRMRESGYSGIDDEYVNYKKEIASDPVELDFPPNFYPCLGLTVVTKTSTPLAPLHPDGKVRVGDTIEYTIIARNDGHPNSTWTDAVVTDTMPVGVTFANNVRIDGFLQTQNVGFTFLSGILTVPLGDIPGGTQKRVTFNATVNESAYGIKIVNTARVAGKDGNTSTDVIVDADDGDGQGGGGLDIVDRSAAPTIDPVTEGDATITGTGVIGADVVVNPGDGGASITVVVVDDGSGNGVWSADVSGRRPITGRTITAVQTEPNKDPSPQASTVTVARPPVIKNSAKTSENLTRSDGSRRVGDMLRYTITVKNDGLPKSLWQNVIIIDTVPTEVNYVPGSVTIDTLPAGSAANYSSGVLTVNLGDIPGGVTKVVTFDAEINNTAYGKTFVNTALIDGDSIIEGPTVPPPVYGQTAQPVVDEVNEGDKIVEGDGINGATVTVTFPDGVTTRTATVSGGRWSVTVPNSINLIEGNIINVTQVLAPDSASDPVVVTVNGKKPVISDVVKVSQNLTSTDGNFRTGDRIRYTITLYNNGSPKSFWTGAVVTDVIPQGMTLDLSSVLLDGTQPTFSDYNATTRTLRVQVWRGPTDQGIQGGLSATVVFEATINPNANGTHIMNSVTVAGFENGDSTKPVNDGADEDGGGFNVVNKSADPIIDPITRGDRAITGEGEPGATVIVTLPDNTQIPATVANDGTWRADLPVGKEVTTGDVISAVQTEVGKDPSDVVYGTAGDKTGRGIHGLVNPIVTVNPVPGFANMHAITVELRTTFRTPAPSSLRVTATPAVGGLGEFTFENVPFGDYVLVIQRPGFLTRCMNITISPTDLDMRDIAPPNTQNENGVFELWGGDCNGDFRIDNEDQLMVQYYMNRGTSAYDSDYDPAADVLTEGVIDNEDLMRIMSNWNLDASMYAGAETVNFTI
ncbi:MAG: isopeptide-forming domain-containing fimbrial protein [Oscillospiraceae bacterium]|nr:isopeptide-forming domain-containing fimbrial protein [Oscillospiraceae bacterium]